MSILKSELSELKVGTRVKFTQVNGQILEGVISKNDGTESLSVQISATAILKYEQITGLELSMNNAVIPVSYPDNEPKISTQENITENENDDDNNDEMLLSFDETTLSNAFKSMESNERKELAQSLNKCQTALKNHEKGKINEALNLAWSVIEENEWDYNKKVNAYYAQLQAIYGDYEQAGIAFAYANEFRTAYKLTYEYASKTANDKLYEYSGKFSALYFITEHKAEHMKEAEEVLKKSSEKCCDISGIQYIVNNNPSGIVLVYLREVIKYLGTKCKISFSDLSLSNLQNCINELKVYYPAEEIISEIGDYYPKETVEQPETVSAVVQPQVEMVITPSIEPSDPNKEYRGQITHYKFTEASGKITYEDKIYVFELDDVSDIAVKNRLKKVTSLKLEEPIPVLFRIGRPRYKKETAVDIKNGYVPKDEPKEDKKISKNNAVNNPDVLFSKKKYEEAIELFKEQLDTDDWQSAFSKIVQCYMALWNQNDNMGYREELIAFVDKYADKVTDNTKALESLQQAYMKTHKYKECLKTLNIIMEQVYASDYNKTLHIITSKAKCYRELGDINAAISNLLDWLNIVKENRLTETNNVRDSIVHIELAELYFDSEDYNSAEKYANKSSESMRKQSLLEKLSNLKSNTENDEYDEDDEEEYELLGDNEENSSDDVVEIHSLYTDEDDFECENLTEFNIVNRINEFEPDELYCIVTYLSALSKVTENSDENLHQNVKSLESVFSYAFYNPLFNGEVNSTQIICDFDNTKNLIPEINNELFASATLKVLFENSEIPDYNLDDLIVYMETTDIAEKFPSLMHIANSLNEFRNNTGFGIDLFAAYKTNTTVIESIIEEANELREAIDKRNDIFESQGQVRRLRENLFSSDDSELRKCLNIAAENNINRYQYAKEKMAELFIRNGRTISAENYDINKINRYIDYYWDVACKEILDEKRSVSRPHDKIKSGKRGNVIANIKKIIACVCKWLNAAEHIDETSNFHAKSCYAAEAPQIYALLEELLRSCEKNISENGFDWGTESIRLTAKELLSKLGGSYCANDKKYFFIGFLAGENILLNDDYIPDITSTFCGLSDFNIIERIEKHIAENPKLTPERISEIFSEDIEKHNFRTARLIKKYAADMGISELSEHEMFTYLSSCIQSGKKRVDILYEDFRNQLELYESCGCISDINGEKSKILRCIHSWYSISKHTNDFGFYARLLNAFKNKISALAAKHGEKLMCQLEELANNPEYDFGVYPKETIAQFINDQNYTVAEDMMNCVRRHDTKSVTDYTIEPFGYLNSFINEYATNHRAVVDAGINLEAAIIKHAGKKDIEKALRQLTTNNSSKDIKGGCNLISNWIVRSPAGTQRIEKLLSVMGFIEPSISNDTANSEDSYDVKCKKQTGKVNYPHPIPAFSSLAETEGFRVLCLYGRFDCDRLMDKFREVNTVSKHTLVFLDYALNLEERRRLARKIKEEKTFAKSFVVVDRVLLFYLAKHYAANIVSRMMMAIAMPFAYYQPFVEKSKDTMPPELFIGRETELVSIESADGANLVYGGRQLGKSALLKMAQNNIDKNANGDRALLVELIDLDYVSAAKVVSEKLVNANILPKGCECTDWDTLANHIENRLNDDNPETRINYLLLMLDEADKFIESCKEVNYRPISVLKNLPSGRFKVVMAGIHNLSRFNRDTVLHRNSILVHLESIVIRQFKRPEAIKLLTNTLAYLGFRFKDSVISLILAKTNYFPGLIQLYCKKLLETMKNDYAGYPEVNTPSYEVTEDHIKKVLSNPDFAEEIKNKLEITLFVEETGRSHYHIIALIIAYLNYISPSPKGYTSECIFNIAEEYRITRITSLKKEQLEELLHEMWDLNLLSANGEYYVFATEGLREMLGSQENVEQKMSKYFGEGEDR